MAAVWQSQPPTSSGAYWFYGRRGERDACQLWIIEVHAWSKGCGYMSRGMACDPAQMLGWWTPVEAPRLPVGVGYVSHPAPARFLERAYAFTPGYPADDFNGDSRDD